MSRATLVKPLGIVSQPNTVGQYPDGALSQAHNVHLRNPGVLTTLSPPTTYKSNAGATNHVFKRIWASPTQLLAASDTGSAYQLRWINGSTSTSIGFPELGAFSYATGKIQVAQHRGRYFVTSDQGVLTLGSDGATAGYLAGFPAPRLIDLSSIITAAAQAIEDQKTAAWCAIFVRKASDGTYTKIGPPSYQLRIDNEFNGGPVDYALKVGFSTAVGTNLQVGDLIELYRTPTQDLDTDPGEDFKLAATHVIVSGDLVAGYAVITDSTPDSGLGADLYTGAGEEGALAAKYPPGLATDVAVFKGHTFYVVTKETGSITLRVPGQWGFLDLNDADRTHGIGRRGFRADATSGSAVLTDVFPDTLGIVAGQSITDNTGLFPYVPSGATVVSTTSNTITMSAVANGTVNNFTGFGTSDRIEINGSVVDAGHPQYMLRGLGASNTAQVTLNQPTFLSDIDTFEEMEGVEFSISAPWYLYGIPTVRATNGQNYDPPLPSLTQTATSGTNDTRLNRLRISELDQPEAVPFGEGNELLVGTGEIYRIFSTTDALWCFCSDGLYRVSGEYPDWRVDPVDPTLVLSARNALDILRGDLWAFTNRGLVAVTPNGIQEVSQGLIGDVLPGVPYFDTSGLFVAADEQNREVHVVSITEGPPGSFTSFAYVWNTLTSAFTTTDYDTQYSNPSSTDLSISALAYAPYLSSIVFGSLQTASAADIKVMPGSNPLIGTPGASVAYQPVTGDGDTFTLKNWIDCTYLFGIYASGYTVKPFFNNVGFPDGIVVELPYLGSGKDTRGVAACPTELESTPVALAPDITPGFTVAAATNSGWRFRGLSLRFVMAAEEWGR